MEKRSLAVENFKEMVMKAAADHLKRPLTAAERSNIQKDIDAKSHILSRTPNHPPYAAVNNPFDLSSYVMIHEAIREMNNESGSNEESISNFIRKKYPDLPHHHSSCLKLYLHKQCDRKEIIMTTEQCYILNPPDSTVGSTNVQDRPEDQKEVRAEQKVVRDEGDLSRDEQCPIRRGRGRGREREERATKQKPKEASTSDLILGVVGKNNSQEPKEARARGRGRLRKL